MEKLLIVESNIKILNDVKTKIKNDYLIILQSTNFQETFEMLDRNKINIVVLNMETKNKKVNLDAMEICKKIKSDRKKYNNTYIAIIGPENASYEDKKAAFLAGANSFFLRKSEFRLFELLIKSKSEREYVNLTDSIKYGDLEVFFKSCNAYYKKEYIYLSFTEHIILLELIKGENTWVKLEKIKEGFIIQKRIIPSDNAVRTALSRLKQKFIALDKNIITQRYRGYFLKSIK